MPAAKKLAKKPIDILGPANELEELLKTGQADVQDEFFLRGEEVASLFFDLDLARSNAGFQVQLKRVVTDAVEDLCNGAPVLAKNQIGIVISEGRLFPFAGPYETEPPGEVVFSFGLRSAPTNDTIGEDDACAAIYRLIVFSALESGS